MCVVQYRLIHTQYDRYDIYTVKDKFHDTFFFAFLFLNFSLKLFIIDKTNCIDRNLLTFFPLLDKKMSKDKKKKNRKTFLDADILHLFNFMSFSI